MTTQVTERMRLRSEHRRAFEPPAEAPVKAECAACEQPVVDAAARVVDLEAAAMGSTAVATTAAGP